MSYLLYNLMNDALLGDFAYELPYATWFAITQHRHEIANSLNRLLNAPLHPWACICNYPTLQLYAPSISSICSEASLNTKVDTMYKQRPTFRYSFSINCLLSSRCENRYDVLIGHDVVQAYFLCMRCELWWLSLRQGGSKSISASRRSLAVFIP